MTPREHAERNAVILCMGSALVMAVICGAIIISGWFAGVMEDHAERWFWAGSILGLVMVFTFAGAAFPGGRNDLRVVQRITWLTRIGLLLLIVAPTMCLGALVADFYG